MSYIGELFKHTSFPDEPAEIESTEAEYAAEIERLRQQLKDARDELDVYRLASERAIYDAQQFDAALYLNTDRGVEDVMRKVLARLGEYEGEHKRWHSFETVRAIAKERDALQAEANRYYANWQAEKSIIHNVEDETQWATINEKRIAALETERRQAVAERDAARLDARALAEALKMARESRKRLVHAVRIEKDFADAGANFADTAERALRICETQRDTAQADARALAEALNRFDGADTDELPFIADDAMSVLQEHGAKYLETQP